jgi:hypothetical protein
MAFIQRIVPQEILRLRRLPKRASRFVQGTENPSLVNCNHLATTDTKLPLSGSLAEALSRETVAKMRRVNQRQSYKQITETLFAIAVREASNGGERVMAGLLEKRERNKQRHKNDAWRKDRMEALKDRPREGAQTDGRGPWSAAKDYQRVKDCQSLWIGFKADCCSSRAIAVPVGCNHRLCPLCNAARLEHYRGPAREMLAAMKYPTFLTLTVPNVGDLSSKTFDNIRTWWKAFFRSNKERMRGGIYSVEVTYNREAHTWHPHIHVIFDSGVPYFGMKRCDNCQELSGSGYSVEVSAPRTRKVAPAPSSWKKWRWNTNGFALLHPRHGESISETISRGGFPTPVSTPQAIHGMKFFDVSPT